MKYIVMCLLFTGCVSVGQKAIRINPGDTPDQVISIMGPPEDRQTNGQQEAWQYCSDGSINGMYVIVWFKEARVLGTSNYSKPVWGTCNTGFNTVRWEQAPTMSIEIRNR